MALTVEFRRGTEHDGGGIAELFGKARAEMQYLPRLHTAEEDCGYFRGELRHRPSLIAVVGRKVVGFAIFGEGWLHHLYVDGEHRRCGIGRELLSAVKAQSAGEIQLWTFQANDDARRFYEREGFVAIEETDGRGNEEKVPDVRYIWSGL